MAAGDDPTDSTIGRLHSIPIVCKVIQETANEPRYGDRNGMQNRIVSYKPTTATKTGLSEAPPRRQDEDPSHESPPPDDDDQIPF